ncbi:hypothetical protein EFK50_07825 [Nocardioides marmoriginsengisoli]|uniref:Scaffolding protein n=1 Tax=Nocardioides marmoriginsengisoli TaxID=661483 RepID=A0A3N0CJM6_9ACTN|nr:hypothetical protein [Nocardioides marmoriginsengisoli]RNL63642.1 hypothetical protein EFK50_07825 [Nocardioides marmoriginsengisoli]
MSVAPAEPTPTPTEPPAAATTPPAPTPPVDPPKASEPNANPWADPAAAEAEIKRLRAENAKDRTSAKAQAAEEARKELAQSIGKSLGLVEDDANDPAKLTESLTTSQAEAKQARVELAVFRNAAAAGGDPAALLDSSSFLASLAAVDPSDSAAIAAAIQAAVTANPRLGAAPADPKAPAPNPAQGGSASGSTAVDQLTREQVEQMGRDGKHAEIEKAREEGRLNNLLGIKS